MKNISIYLFGTPVIKIGQEVFLLKRKRARALIYYLAVSMIPVSRQELISILFPQLDSTTAFKNLSTYLHNINTDIPGMLEVGKEFISIPKSVYVDVREFNSCLTGNNLSKEAAKRAKELYKDVFLKSFHLDDSYEFEQWINLRGEYFKNRAISAATYLADDFYKNGQYWEALDIMMDILELDPYREDIYIRAMRANCEMGNRPGAVKLYEKLNALLAEELGISPMPETIRFYSDIITGKVLRSDNIKRMDEEEYCSQEKEKIYNGFSEHAKKLCITLLICRNKFDLRLLSNVLEITEQEVLYALDEIRKQGILMISSDNSIVLRNPEERKELLNLISVPEQNYLNYRIAQEIEKHSDSRNFEVAEDLLYYYQHSNDNEKILEYALKVGEEANDREDFSKALDCYRRACKYLHGEKLLELKSSIAQIELLIGNIGGAREILLENAAYAKKNYQFGLASSFELEAYLSSIPGFQEILWGFQPQYPMKEDERQLSNIWIAEQYLQQEPENLYYYIRFLQCKALYCEFLMRTEEALESYEKIIDLCKNNKNARLKNYIDIACMKLGAYHKDTNITEKYLRIGIAHANECKNLRTLPALLALSAHLDISLGRVEVPKYNLEWAASLASNLNNVYVQFLVNMAMVDLKLVMEQKEEAVHILQTLLDQATKVHATHVQVAVHRKIVSLDSIDAKLLKKSDMMLKELAHKLPLN